MNAKLLENQKPVVIIVDDDARVLESLGRLLELCGYIVQTFSSSREVLSVPLPTGACCAIIDAQLPKVTGIELQSLLVKKRPGLPVIFISGYGDIPSAVQAMKGGATDFLIKPIEEKVLLDACRRALVQEEQFRRDRLERDISCKRFGSLTVREREVCGRVTEGKLNKQIASELGICEKTVKVHRGRVMRKMNVCSVAELVRAMVRLDRPSPVAAAMGRQWAYAT